MTKIRSLRKQKGLSQVEMAKLTNLYPSNLSSIETGASKAGKKLQERIASALDVAASEIFDGLGWPLGIDTAIA